MTTPSQASLHTTRHAGVELVDDDDSLSNELMTSIGPPEASATEYQ